MNLSTRFGKGALVACMAAVAACTSTGDDGKTSGTELNVVFPGGTLGDFEIGRVTVTAQCDGDNSLYPQNESGDPIGNVIPSMPNDDDGDGNGGGTQFQTDLEFENSDAGAEIWHTFTDMLGLCLLKVEAYQDGELFCVGGGSATVTPGDTAEVNVIVACDISQEINTGRLDLRGTTVTSVGNFCPLFNSLELIPDDIPLVANELYPMQDTTEMWVCGIDSGDVGTIQLAQGELASCTDQIFGDASYVEAFDRCDVQPDPERVTYTCRAEVLDALGGNVIGDSTGIFTDPANGGFGQDGDGDPTTYNGLCLAGLSGGLIPDSKGFFTCDTANQPGQPVRITCGGDDGDNDCYKERSQDLDCPGQNLCDPFPPECVDPDPDDCTVKTACDATVGGTSCVDTDAPAGQDCTTTQGGPGECGDPAGADGGVCVATGCASDAECAATEPDPCLTSTCNFGTGFCNASVPANELGSCTNDAGGPGQCVAGSCDCTAAVCECESNADCVGGDECNDVACDAIAGTCGAVVPKAACTACGNPGDVCFDGACSTPATFSNDFDLSNSVFRAYNALLADNLPTCRNPDLNDSAKCIEVDATGTPPAIAGGVAFSNTGGNNWDVSVQQDLVFQIAAAIAGATVDITTESQNTIVGTGTGDVAAGDSIVMDALGLPAPKEDFNMDVSAAGGTVLCEAWNRIFQGALTPCDSTVCTDPTAPCPACPLWETSSGGQTCGFLTANECDPTELSDVICDAAALGPAAGATCVSWPQDTTVQSEAGCLNQLPKPADEGYREMPPWTFALPTTAGSADECNQLDMQLAGGSTTVSGWYIGNPDESADQFTALQGVQQP